MRPPASRTSKASTVLDDLDGLDVAVGTTVVPRGLEPRLEAKLLTQGLVTRHVWVLTSHGIRSSSKPGWVALPTRRR
jgi:hypothetical protein